LLGFALAMSPVLAAADQSPTTDAAGSFPRPNFAAMQQMHAQLEQIHKQARLQLLASLTPAHRTLLANVVGQLAISPNPDRAVAARSLDAALSQGEQRSVLSVEAAARTQSHNLMEASRAQFEASLTPDQRAAMQTRMESRANGHEGMQAQRTPDPGMILLDLAGGEGHEHHGFGPGGPMGMPPPQ
jgi:Spy/CpxP family protein refolding chaperone